MSGFKAPDHPETFNVSEGRLTKREWMVGQIVASRRFSFMDIKDSEKALAQEIISLADAILRELEETEHD